MLILARMPSAPGRPRAPCSSDAPKTIPIAAVSGQREGRCDKMQ
jgi:hypothetical protein